MGHTMNVNGYEININGYFVKIGKLRDEGYVYIEDPVDLINKIKKDNRHVDIFTFTVKISNTENSYPYCMEYDNFAALPITTYDNWFNKQIDSKTRNMVRKAAKKGVLVGIHEYNEDFVRGIQSIYNETPIRQGRPFWHYGKDFEIVKKENETFLDRSIFIGAYYQNELIGFEKVVYENKFASIMQIVSMIRHRDKASTNLLIAKAVEICSQKKIPYLIYSKFSYGKKHKDTLADFKESNGFVKKEVSRYFVPITFKGEIALILKLHRNIIDVMPYQVTKVLRKLRNKFYKYKYSSLKLSV